MAEEEEHVEDGTTQADESSHEDSTDWKAEARKWEQRAKSNKDAADELAQLKEAQKTEGEKLRDRADRAEAKVKQMEATAAHAATVRKVMEAEHVDARFAPLLTAETEEALTEQARLIASRFAEPVLSDTGKQVTTGTDPNASFAHALFTGGKH